MSSRSRNESPQKKIIQTKSDCEGFIIGIFKKLTKIKVAQFVAESTAAQEQMWKQMQAMQEELNALRVEILEARRSPSPRSPLVTSSQAASRNVSSKIISLVIEAPTLALTPRVDWLAEFSGKPVNMRTLWSNAISYSPSVLLCMPRTSTRLLLRWPDSLEAQQPTLSTWAWIPNTHFTMTLRNLRPTSTTFTLIRTIVGVVLIDYENCDKIDLLLPAVEFKSLVEPLIL